MPWLIAELDRRPDDPQLRLRLAREQRVAGHWEQAERTLAPLTDSSSPPVEVLRLWVELALDAWRAGHQDAARVLARWQAFAQRATSGDQLAYLAQIARELGRNDLAAEANERAAGLDRANCASWLEAAARDRLAAADPKRSAESLAGAYACSEERADGIRALDAYVAADLGAEALRLADTLSARFPADREVLERVARLALARNDLARSLRATLLLVKADPANPALRFAAAKRAAWAGQPREALAHWMWLARNGHDGQPALALARGLEDHDALAELLRSDARRNPFTPARLEELAALQERRGDLAAALGTRLEIARAFGDTPARSVDTARLRWMLGNAEEAHRELERHSDRATADEAGYWELLAELAWNLEADSSAARAYATLWKAGRIDPAGAERLFLLHRDAGRAEDAIRLGSDGWTRLDEPRLLLLAMSEAARLERWDDLARLLEKADQSPDRFERFTSFWLLRALHDERSGRVGAAIQDYRRALEHDPASETARSGLLWVLSNAGERQLLAEQLATWRASAESDPSLWAAYAAGLDLLGRDQEALVFYHRLIAAEPSNIRARERMAAVTSRSALAPPDPHALLTVRAEAASQSFGRVLAQRLGVSARAELRSMDLELRAAVDKVAAQQGLELLAGVATPAFGGWTEVAGGAGWRSRQAVPRGLIAHTRMLAPFAEARLEGALNEVANDSATLMADAVRSRAGGTLTLTSGPVYGRGGAEWKTWSARNGAALGSGAAGNLELGVRFQLTGPELSLRLQGTHQRHAAPGVLPDELSSLGVGVGASRWQVGPARLVADAWLGWISSPHRPAYRLQTGLALAPFDAAEVSVTGWTANDLWASRGSNFGLSASLAYQLPATSP